MPPDEYHSGVNNSVYTNVLVQNRSDPGTPDTPPHRTTPLPCARASRSAGLQPPLTTSAPSLRFAAALAQDLGQPVPPQWLEVADNIKVPFDPEQNFHPEYDGYEPGECTWRPFPPESLLAP